MGLAVSIALLRIRSVKRTLFCGYHYLRAAHLKLWLSARVVDDALQTVDRSSSQLFGNGTITLLFSVSISHMLQHRRYAIPVL